MTEKKQRITVEKKHRSRRARRARDNSPVSLASSHTESIDESSDESGVLDMLASTLFCVGSLKSHPDKPSKTRVQVKAGEKESGIIGFCQDLWSFFICGRLPCQYVTTFDSQSVDESVLTLPTVLVKMAAEYDRENSTKARLMGDTLHRTEGDREFIPMAEPRSSTPASAREPLIPARAWKLLMGNRSGVSYCSRSVDSRMSKGSRRTKVGRVGADKGESGYKPDGGVNKKPMDKGQGVLLAPAVGKEQRSSLSRRRRTDFVKQTLYEL